MADETRTERTDYAGLLALYNADGKSQRWGWPYWGPIQVDALLAGLHDAPRDGVALVTAPAAPTLNGLATGGYLLAATTYEVVQTFVDEYGRETEASTADTVLTASAIVDPAAAASLAVASAAAGFAGGLFEVWYSWVDADARETLASPVVSTNLPYLASPLENEVTVTLPVTPASVGAAGANIYIQHRGGNKVLAAVIATDTVTVAVLDGTISNCSLALPTVNSTGATAAIEITGAAANGSETPSLTRFYIRKDGQTWTDADRRLKLGGVDEWDPATVSYPLTFTGLSTEMVPGYPPTVSQVKVVRPVALATEVTGVLAAANLDAALARDAEIAALLGGPYVLSGLLVEAQAAPDMTVKTSTGWAISDERIWNPALDASIAIAAAHATLERIDIVCVNASGAIVSSSEDATCKGTADAAPVAPSTPAHYVLLATISVPATDTTIGAAQITDSRTLHATLGQLDIDTDAHAASTTIHPPRATNTEINTGTDTNKVATPDALAGSYVGTKSLIVIAVEQATDVDATDGKMYFPVPPALNGMNLVSANAIVNTAGTTNATTVDIYNVTDSQDMLSTAISIASAATVGTAGTVDVDFDDVATNDVLRVDVTSASTTNAKGLMVMLEFRLP